jgi:hypothetical protein
MSTPISHFEPSGELPIIGPGTPYWTPGPIDPPRGLPITTPGPGWHVGHGVGWESPPAPPIRPSFGFLEPSPTLSPFAKAARFGVIDNSVLVAAAVAGTAFDAQISSMLNIPRGWGPLLGVASANVLGTATAGLSEGVQPAIGYLVGAAVPLVPLAAAAYAFRQAPESRMAQGAILVGAAVLSLAAISFIR